MAETQDLLLEFERYLSQFLGGHTAIFGGFFDPKHNMCAPK